MIAEAVHESFHSRLVEFLSSLIHLIDILITCHVVTVNGERDDQLDAVGLHEL